MNIRIQESPGAADTEVVITCRRADEQILKMISLLHTFEKKLTGVKDGETFLLDAASVLYIDTVDKKLFFTPKMVFLKRRFGFMSWKNGFLLLIFCAQANPAS